MEPSEVSPVAHAAASVPLTHRQHGLSSFPLRAPVQTLHQMVHTAFRQLSVPLLPMENSLWCPVLAKLSVQSSLLQHGQSAVQLCVIHLSLESIVPVKPNARHGIAANLLSPLFPQPA
jgi:hypothetical protein